MQATLEDALLALATEHDLTVVTIGVRADTPHPEYRFSAVAHWDGFSRSGNTCAMGDGPDAATALKAALASAATNRVPFVDKLPPVSLVA